MFGGGGFTASNNVFASKQQTQNNINTGQSQDIANQIINTVKQDMEAWEKSGQWIFSCYSCAKDCISIPGLQDLSPEELRFEAYENVKANSTAYQGKVSQLAQEYKSKRALLANPDPQLRTALLNIYNRQPIGDYVLGTAPSSIFGSANSTQAFGGQQNSGGLFGSKPTNSLFGGGQPQQQGQTSIFGGSQTFGGGSTTGQTNSLFRGNSSQQSAFGGGNKGLFGGSTTNTGGGGIFGGNSGAAGGNSVFGGSSNTGAAAGGGIFGGSSGTTTGGGLFGGGATTSGNTGAGIFGGSSSTSTGGGIFGGGSQPQQNAGAQGGGIFGGGNTGASLFGNQNTGQTTATGATTGASLFGQQNNQQGGGLFGQPSNFGSTTNQTTASPFGSNNTTTATSSPFGGGSVTAGSNQTAAPPFGSSAGNGAALFGNKPESTGDLFKQPAQNENLFGQKTDSTSGTLFGQRDEDLDPSCVYSTMEQLSQEEIQAFQSESFELGRIPLNPPPKELCQPVK